MAATEVTRSQYAEYLSERKLSALPEQRLEVKDELKLPITHITYADAQAFCAWLTEKEQAVELIGAEEQYRLPFDDEWSMAAGLPRELGTVPAESHLRTRGFYPWGFDQEVMNANVGKVSDGKATDPFPMLAPAGSFKANGRNLFDLSGNVWEWVEEAYGGEDSISRDYGTIRGGSWRTTLMEQLLSSYRMAVARDGRRDDIGFRIVLTRGLPARAEE
jgi:eukaryotic-like serine/threonine-protein kinase